MDIRTSLQKFEETLNNYTGDDPLDLWERYVGFLDNTLPAEQSSGISVVLDRLVQVFLPQKRYCNDIRYISLCIRCASYYNKPIDIYNYIHSEGVGTRTAALYVAWAQQFEKQGLFLQADVVYQRAIENQAEPADDLLQQYRLFQARVPENQSGAGGVVRGALQNSELTNQMDRQREPLQCKDPEGVTQLPADRRVIIISKSDNAGQKQAGQTPAATLQYVSMYYASELQCEGSEFCFEELRASRYFQRHQQLQQKMTMEEMQKQLLKEEEEVKQLQTQLTELENLLAVSTEAQQCPLQDPYPLVGGSAERLPPGTLKQVTVHPHTLSESSVFASGFKGDVAFRVGLEPQPASQQQHTGASPMALPLLDLPGCSLGAPQALAGLQGVVSRPENQVLFLGLSDAAGQPTGARSQQSLGELNVLHSDVRVVDDIRELSHGGTGNQSYVTPNSSLALVQATPSRVQPSPTINTREALDVIMDMFQAPTFIQDGPFNGTCQDSSQDSFEVTKVAVSVQSAAVPPFAIFQDENDQENAGVAFGVEEARKARVLADIAVPKLAKPNDPSPCVESTMDDSMVWGARYNNTLAPCPNTTGDFALPAHLVSTPFHTIVSHPWDSVTDQESGSRTAFGEEKPFLRQSNKLSPILEQSPPEEKGPLLESRTCSIQNTVLVGQQTSASCSLVVQPAAALSFPEQTFRLDSTTTSGITVDKAQGDWDVCMNRGPVSVPEPDWGLTKKPEGSIMSNTLKPMSPEDVPVSSWHPPKSPEGAPISSWVLPQNSDDASMSDVGLPNADWLFIRSPEAAPIPDIDLPEIPERTAMSNWALPQTPERAAKSKFDILMSPEPTPLPDQDVPMSPDTCKPKATQFVPDPWDEDLIARLLSTLPTPLSSSHSFFSWDCKVPTITAKTTVTIGDESFQVDCILGEGAFATVYQARDLASSKKLVLKVQKPANPWEFYINSQLKERLPSITHLFSTLYSAHVFQNGSVLLGELHSCGTLLNAVNMYRNSSDKVMPQPLALYFAVCILQMVELLHSIHIIHADIKPDNFLLGERFLENECFEPDHLDHGLVLIDLGQSIDMTLFPEGTAFTAKCMTSGFQCTEMLSGRPWTYQTDYFGIVGTVYCLIFGTYMNVRNENGVWKTNGIFKRNPHGELWTQFFHDLLNVPDCSSQPCLPSWRKLLSKELQSNYGSKLRMLKKRLVGQLLESKRSRK